MLKNISKKICIIVTSVMIAGKFTQVVHALPNKNVQNMESKNISKVYSEIQKDFFNNTNKKIENKFIENVSKYQIKFKTDEVKKKKMSITKTEYTRDYSTDNGYKYQVIFNIKNNYDNEKLYRQQLKDVIVNGVKYTKDFSVAEDNKYYFGRMGLDLNTKSFNKDQNEVILKADGFEDLRFKIRKDGSLIREGQKQTDPIADPNFKLTKTKTSKEDTDAINIKAEKIKLSEGVKLEDGVYTIGFKAYRLDKPSDTSMLGGFFDNKVKVEVNKGKINTTWLNLLKAYMLYDFRIESNGVYCESKSKNYGETDNNGKYEMQTFKIPMDHLEKTHTGGVIVSAMGGQRENIGNIDKYTKVKLVFDKEITKGWSGFNYEKEKLKEKEELQNKIFEALNNEGLDFNRDGVIDANDLNRAQGEIILSSKKLSDMSWVKYLGADVTSLIINGNNIKSLPKGVFDRLVNLENLDLSANMLRELPDGIFDKLTNLKTLTLSSNQLENLNPKIFSKLTNLEGLTLNKNNLNDLPKGIFDNLSKLNFLGLSENNFEDLRDDIFINNINIKSLFLSNNKIHSIPTSIKNAINLEILDINKNKIEKLPNEFKLLKNIKKLYLNNNSIKDIPVDVYKSWKEITTLEINDNDITEIPENIEEILPNLFKGRYSTGLEIKYNKILEISPKIKKLSEREKLKYIPQKNMINLKLINDNGILKWDSKLSILDILCWGETPNDYFDNINPKTLEEYKKYLNGKSEIDVLNKKGWDWTIQVEIQKKNQNGKFETIHTITKEEEEDKAGSYSLGDIKNNNDYRIIKSLYGTTMGDKSLIFKETAYVGDKLNNPIKIFVEKDNKTTKSEEDNITTKSKKIVKETLENKENNSINNKKHKEIKNNENKNLKEDNLKENQDKDIHMELPKTGTSVTTGTLVSLGIILSGLGIIFRKRFKK